MIKYIGSKRKLVSLITSIINEVPKINTVLDLFSGTSRVGHALKRGNFAVIANDHNTYAHTIATCYVQADLEKVEKNAKLIIKEFRSLPSISGYFTETFCINSKFFHPKNGARIDAIREDIEKKCLEPELKSVVLVSLMEAADRVDRTTGLQMAYLKKEVTRSDNDLELRFPDVLPIAKKGKGKAYQLEAQKAVECLCADLAYIDPPYNSHSYLCNYHIWETLVLWEKPEVYGIANKRVDCKERKSEFNSKKSFKNVFRKLLNSVQSKYLLVSFNNEGYISKEELEEILKNIGNVVTFEVDYQRYIGSKIGIYNPGGVKTGKISHIKNKEYLFLCGKDVNSFDFNNIIKFDSKVKIVK